MSLCVYDKELIRASVGNYIIGIYKNEGRIDETNVIKHFTDRFGGEPEVRSYISSVLRKWMQHLERKRKNYVQKSKCVNWLTDATYDLSME